MLKGGVRIIGMEVMCSVIGYEGDSHPGRGKRESMITDLGNIKEFMHGGRGLIGREKIHRDGQALQGGLKRIWALEGCNMTSGVCGSDVYGPLSALL